MDQSLSGGSGAPSRMTLTVICSFRESSDMRGNYTMSRFLVLSRLQKKRADLCSEVAVGISIARHPPHRPVRALLTHTVLTLDIWRRSAQWDKGGEHESQEANGPDAP
jgi:hypothetical protein